MRQTSRASNAAWYKDALDLPYQLHIRADGSEVVALYHDKSKNAWAHGPVLTPDSLLDPERVASLAADIIRSARSHGANSIGVVLHIADEFATAELKPELDNPGALDEIRASAIQEPASILADSNVSTDQFSWRLIPYPASGGETIGTTIVLGKQYADLVQGLRKAGEEANFPLIVRACSAPLIALMSLGAMVKPTLGKPFVCILQYPWFTLMAFFNDHADLRLLRTLPHRGIRRATNFRHTLITTNASLEFEDPDLFLVPMGQTIDTTLAANLRVSFPDIRLDTPSFPVPDGVPSWCPEPALAIAPTDGSRETTSHTFSTLKEDGWATQDFLPIPRDLEEIYPNRSEMKLLRMMRVIRVSIIAIGLVAIIYLSSGIIQVVRKPEWAFDAGQTSVIKARLAKYTADRQQINHWGNLLEDRSKAWATMEALVRMFPQNKGFLIKSYNYSAHPDIGGGKQTVGFMKEWRITGLARDEALEALNILNTRDGINAHFADVAKYTGNTSFDPSAGTRSISVSVKTNENPGFKNLPPEEASPADDSTYSFAFELRLTQRFEASDPMALFTAKAP